MIPEKICGLLNTNGDLMDFALKPLDGIGFVQYTLSPTIKKFADELPKDGELICLRTSKQSVWAFQCFMKTYSLPELNDFEWFPVILPEESK